MRILFAGLCTVLGGIGGSRSGRGLHVERSGRTPKTTEIAKATMFGWRGTEPRSVLCLDASKVTTSASGRFCCKSRLRAAATRDSVTLMRISVRSIHDGPSEE
jgi:hypothetical protein